MVIILPTIVVAAAVAIVVWRLPNVYQSNTLLTVRPSNIMQGIVPQLSDDDLTIRINAIGQDVFSRSSLEPLITTYNLYAVERRRGEPMEMLVERMAKKDTRIELNKSKDEITNGFILTFRGPDPYITQKVTSDLASKYVNAQLKQQTQGAGETAKFSPDPTSNRLRPNSTSLTPTAANAASQHHNLPSSATRSSRTERPLYEQQKASLRHRASARSKTMLTRRSATSRSSFNRQGRCHRQPDRPEDDARVG